jgi:MFS family permease
MTLDILCGVLGIWSAAAVPPAQGMLGTIYERPSRRKNKSFGAFSAGNPLGFVFGTILSGLFTQVFNWRAGFFLLAIVYFVTTVIACFTVPGDTTTKRSLDEETIKKLDLPGTAMTIMGIGMFCAALRYIVFVRCIDVRLMVDSLASDAPQGWKTPYVLVLLLLGLLLIAAFVVWETKYPYAMIDMAVWKDRDFSLVSIEIL